MAKTPRDPFDVPLDADQLKTIGLWLSYELLNAIAARSTNEQEIDYWHTVYEQARTRTSNLPWADAADLTSYIACEQVDSIHARMMRTVWTEPFCTVAGYGTAADRAPFVEEFHQWKVEEEGLQSVLDRAFLTGLIEPRFMIEVSESSETRIARKTIKAKLQTDPVTGGFIFDAKGNAQAEVGPDGKYVEATSPDDAAVTMIVDSPETIRSGPAYRVLPYRDSLILPGHARDDDEIWGYAKRIWKRKGDLLAAADAGIYKAAQVDQLTDVGDRLPTASLERAHQEIAPQQGPETAEKELWEALVLVDLNALFDRYGQATVRGLADRARWYLVTLNIDQNLVIRLQHDDLDRGRYVSCCLYPRPDRVTEGYSLIGHKLITVIEEHTAFRNMGADATSKAVNAPIKRLVGALWDPDEQPLGPKSVTDVRDMREWEPVQMPEVPSSVFEQQRLCTQAAQRLGGINDIASGQNVAKGNPTLGEIQMATEQSFIRMDLVVRRAQKAIESLMQIRHAIWKRVLAEQPQGIDAPESLVVGLEGRGVPIDQYLPDGKITAQLLDGPFRFKPYGSVETADVNRLRADAGQFMQFIAQFVQMFPEMAGVIHNPQFARGLLRYMGRLYRVPNMQAILGSPSQDLLGQGGVTPGPQVPGMQPGLPGMMPMPRPIGAMRPQGVPPMPQPMAPSPMGVQ